MKKNVLIVGSSSSLGKKFVKKLNKKYFNVIQTSNNKNIYSSINV